MSSFAFASPIGSIRLQYDVDSITGLQFAEHEISDPQVSVPDHVKNAHAQLVEYFSGSRKAFDIRLSLKGTEFQKRVWQQLNRTEYGNTNNYLQLAIELGNSKCIRAAASANGKNPVPIIIPCHRIIGKDGSLTGYSGGIWRKKWLLRHETKDLCQTPELF